MILDSKQKLSLFNLTMAFPFPLCFPETNKNFQPITYEPTPKHSPAPVEIPLKPVGQNTVSQSIGVSNKSLAPTLVSSHTPYSAQPLLPVRVCLEMLQKCLLCSEASASPQLFD